MTPGGSNIKDRGMTPDQAREQIARKDREGWYPGRHGSGEFGILSARDGREVARCHLEADRDFLVQAARSHDAIVAALESALTFAADESELRGEEDTAYHTQAEPLVKQIGEALAMARGAKP